MSLEQAIIFHDHDYEMTRQECSMYLHLECTERMRRLRQGLFPVTPQNITQFHELLINVKNKIFTQTIQKLQ